MFEQWPESMHCVKICNHIGATKCPNIVFFTVVCNVCLRKGKFVHVSHLLQHTNQGYLWDENCAMLCYAMSGCCDQCNTRTWGVRLLQGKERIFVSHLKSPCQSGGNCTYQAERPTCNFCQFFSLFRKRFKLDIYTGCWHFLSLCLIRQTVRCCCEDKWNYLFSKIRNLDISLSLLNLTCQQATIDSQQDKKAVWCWCSWGGGCYERWFSFFNSFWDTAVGFRHQCEFSCKFTGSFCTAETAIQVWICTGVEMEETRSAQMSKIVGSLIDLFRKALNERKDSSCIGLHFLFFQCCHFFRPREQRIVESGPGRRRHRFRCGRPPTPLCASVRPLRCLRVLVGFVAFCTDNSKEQTSALAEYPWNILDSPFQVSFDKNVWETGTGQRGTVIASQQLSPAT